MRDTVRLAEQEVLIEAGSTYYVDAETLNLQVEPLVDTEVVRVLERNDIVTVLKPADE